MCKYSRRQHWALMGSWGPPMGLIPASHFPIPSLYLPINHLALKFLSQSRLLGTQPKTWGALKGSSPRPWLSITDSTVASTESVSGHSLSSPMDPESWAQFLLQVTHLPGNFLPPGVLGQKKMPPGSKLRRQHLRPGGSQGYPGPLPASLWLMAPSPHLSPGLTTRLPESAPPFCSWYRESVPTGD